MFRRVTCLTLLVACGWASADNGEIAHAHQIDSIQIDGRLDEWPQDLPVFRIQRQGDGLPVAPDSGFDATFRAAYSLDTNAVYVAITVVDDVHVGAPNGEPGEWTDHDAIITYIDFNHTVTGSGAALYLAIDQYREMMSGETSWDADIVDAGWDSADVAVIRDGATTVYEWQFTSSKPLSVDSTIGLDFLVVDHDAPGETADGALYSWGRGFGKSQAGGRTADLLLVGQATQFGTLRGTAVLPVDAEEGDETLRLRVQSLADPRLWMQTRTDAQGAYELTLPVGEYRLSSVDQVIWVGDRPDVIAPAEPLEVAIKANAVTDAGAMELLVLDEPVRMPAQGALFDFSAKDAADLERAMNAWMDHYQVPGVSLALVKDGEVIHHAVYGVQSVYSSKAVTSDTLFEAASITKTVFAFTVNRLAERGEIDLDRPLYTYLPFEEIAHDERYKKITARHVLSHQTGFPNWRWANDDGEMDIKFYPGIQYGYSGEGFEYLGRVVSHILDEPLEDIVRRETVEVMNFTPRTFFAEAPELHEHTSRGHLSGMTGPHDFPSEIGVAYSMYTEASSFANFLIGLLAKEGLSAESYALMLEPQVAVPAEPGEKPGWPARYGLGFHMMNSPFGLAYGHGGHNGNFSCLFEIYPEHDMGFVVFTNADNGWLLAESLREYLVIGAAVDAEESAD